MRRPAIDGRHLVVGSTLLTQLLLVVSGPLALRLLGLEDRGEVAFVFAAVLLVSQVTHGGIPQAWAFWIARHGVAPAALLSSRLRRFSLRAVLMGVMGAIGIGVLSTAQEPLTHPAAELVISAFAIVAIMHAVLALSVLQGSRRFARLAAVQTMPGVLYTGGLVVMALTGTADVISVLVVYFSSWIVIAVWGLLPGRKDVAGEPAPPQAELSSYGRRTLVSASAPIDNLGIDQLLVGTLLLHAGLGAYTVALAFETAPVILLIALGTICMPGIAQIHDPAAQRRYAARWIAIGLALATTGVLLIQLLLEPVLLLAFGQEAEVALEPARILVVAGIFLGLRRLTGSMLQGLGRPTTATAAELVGFAVMVVGMFTLVPRYGLEGACVAMLAAGLVTATLGVIALLVPRRRAAERPREPIASTPPSAPR